MVGINHIIGKMVGLKISIQRNGFMTGKSYRCRSMFAESTCVGQCIHIDSPDPSVFIGSHFYRHFHLMTRSRSDLALFSCKDHLCRFSGLPGDKRRINLCHKGLLRSKTAADPRLAHPYLGLWDPKSRCNDAAYMENDLGGADDIQSAVGIHVGIGTEGLHHRLLIGLRVVSMLNDQITVL